MDNDPIVTLRLPLYTLLLKNGKLAIGDRKAMLWTSVPNVKAFLELFKEHCDNFVIIDTHELLRDFVRIASDGGLTHATLDMVRGEHERVVVLRLDQLVERVGGNPEAN